MKTYRIETDHDPINPREDTDFNLGTIVAWHRKYNFNEETILRHNDPLQWRSEIWAEYGTEEEKRQLVLRFCKSLSLYERKNALNRYREYNSSFIDYTEVILGEELTDHPTKYFPESIIALPVYMYEHSGIALNTSGFSCSWDSGLLGYIYCTKEKAKQALGEYYSEERAIENLKAEIATYASYVNGEVYGFIIEEDGEEVTSCWGFYSYEDCEKEAEDLCK